MRWWAFPCPCVEMIAVIIYLVKNYYENLFCTILFRKVSDVNPTTPNDILHLILLAPTGLEEVFLQVLVQCEVSMLG